MSANVPASLVTAWSSGQIRLVDALGVPTEALHAARALGERCLALGDFVRAEAIFSGLSVLDPTDPRPAVALASLALERGLPEIALAWAERTLSLLPGDAALNALAARARVAIALA